MGFKVGNDFLIMLIDRGLVPDDTIAVNIRIRVGDLPIMTVERMPEAEDVEMFLECIGSTVELERNER